MRRFGEASAFADLDASGGALSVFGLGQTHAQHTIAEARVDPIRLGTRKLRRKAP
jgi:hypothetical protein